MRRVAQKDEHGCGVAVLAMLTDQTYAQVDAAFPHRLTTWEKHSLDPHHMQGYLWDRGWFLRRVISLEVAGAWPPRPFAASHYAMVDSPTAPGGHWVAMDDIGWCLDPFRKGPRALSFYGVAHEVVGLYR